MTLAADVQNRIPQSRLIQLTNLASTPASTVNAAVLGYAVADAENEFASFTGVAYDETNLQHTTIGITGVMFKLCENRGLTEEAEAYRKRWYELLWRFAKTSGLKWFAPGSNVPYSPTTEPSGMRPDADRSRFDDLVPLPPKQFSVTRRATPNQ